MTARRHHRLPYVVAVIWLALTVSLASWWLSIALKFSESLHRMFVWEGASFIVLLLAGGFAIVMAIRREQSRREALETFFMSFTHDLKTSLASVQLQAEGLREDWPDASATAPLDRLLHDIVRLQIQLENSLFVAQPDGRLLRERIDAAAAIQRLAQDWPELAVRVKGNASVLADARGFDVVLRNLLQNAVVHGDARTVEIDVSKPEASIVRLTVTDDGRGVAASAFERLGQPFARTSRTSGTGVGLFVCSQIATRMEGALRFVPAAQPGEGLTVQLDLPGAP
jgi:signal transduction histidine kinase